MDVVTTLVPDINTFSSGQVGGIEVDVGYPASVSMPGSQFLPINDPADPATLIALLSATPGQINLYDGLQTFFDADTAAPLDAAHGADAQPHVEPHLQPDRAVRARTVHLYAGRRALGERLSPATVPQEVNAIGGTVPSGARPPCVLTLAAP